MCDCHDVEMGSYDNQILVGAPPHMPKSNGYCLDSCICVEVVGLWGMGVVTTGCCCGHNKTDGFIGVAFRDIDRMKDLGYQVAPNKSRPGDEDSFYPKTINRHGDKT